MMLSRARLAAGTVLLGLAAAAFTVDLAGVHAESPLEFLMREHRQHRQAPRYEREPVHVERHRVRGRGFFGDLFDHLRRRVEPEPEPEARAPVVADLHRVICRRTCDGSQLVLGIVPASKSRKEEEAMCTAAGGGAETQLVVEKFVPGAGFTPPERMQTASSTPLLEGRAALGGDAEPRRAADPCPGEAERRFMMVPILHDATLRKGDIVATKHGFKVFVGKGKPPFDESDFVDVDKRKRIAASVRDLAIADR